MAWFPRTEEHGLLPCRSLAYQLQQRHDACVLAGPHIEVLLNQLLEPFRRFVVHAQVRQDGRLLHKGHRFFRHVMTRILPPLEGVLPAADGPHEVGAPNPKVRAPRVEFDRKARRTDGLRGVIKGHSDLSIAWNVSVGEQGPCSSMIRFCPNQSRRQRDGILTPLFAEGFQGIEVEVLSHGSHPQSSSPRGRRISFGGRLWAWPPDFPCDFLNERAPLG